MANPLITIGHSTRSIPEFLDLLRASQIGLVGDVRTVPRSRTNPQLNRDALPDTLAAHQIGYEQIAELGELRGKQRAAEWSPNRFWENESFRNYADYALTPEFRAGLDRLGALGVESRVAIKCAEAVWWRCHRRIITDYLLAAGETVFHILGPGKVDEARMTPAASPASAGARPRLPLLTKRRHRAQPRRVGTRAGCSTTGAGRRQWFCLSATLSARC